jgi:hypothetical protein
MLPGRITGRVLLDGVPVDAGAMLVLEDPDLNIVDEARVDDGGVYVFEAVQASTEGYNVLFGQEWNEQYEVDQVITWGWIGPIILEGGAALELPDLDISLLGFEPHSPAPDATFSAAELSAENPITFEWEAYPQATTYWVDLMRGEELVTVWQSPFVGDTSTAFDGTLSDGERIDSGQYWWGVGAQRALGAYTLTVYGYLPSLTIEP